jgi:1-acyl-sn-glycerol-3-phosphate acyltransferase
VDACIQEPVAVPKLITHAQPPLEFVPPAFNPVVYRFAELVLPFWTRWRLQIVDVQVNHLATLAECYRRFQAGELRFMLAFRHPSINDPFCLFHLLDRELPRWAQQQGMRLKFPLHAHFMYDRGIPLWAGKPVGWLLKNLGCTPIRRGKLDLLGLRSAREIFVEGKFPLAAAPEGATNGHSGIISPIEPGIAQLSFWCVEDLLKADRPEEVWIVPVGIKYHYVTPPWEAIEHVLSQLETDCGISPENADGLDSEILEVDKSETLLKVLPDPQQIRLYKRLMRLSEHLLSSMEQFYSKFYHQNLKALSAEAIATPQDIPPANLLISKRLKPLLNASLSVAEEYFNVPAKGNVADRCRRLEQAGWDRIFREDLKELENLSPVDRGLADRIAEEASLRLWHMRLVESFVSVTGHYILEQPTAERFAETLLLLYDTVNKIKGKAHPTRPRLGQQRAQLTIGEPISIRDRWADYKANRRQAVAGLTQGLQGALENLIS